jgi:hypothetical protein
MHFNNLDKTKLLFNNINFDIYKTCNRIFEIGNINLDFKYLKLLDLGLKYVPSFSKFDLYYFLYNFYITLNDLNNSLFYKKSKKSQTLNNMNLCKDSGSVFDYLKKAFPRNKKSFYTFKEIKSFHKSFLNNLFQNLNFSIDSTHDVLFIKKCLNKIRLNKIVIRPCDKNIGISLIEAKLYDRLCFDNLNDNVTYEKLDKNPHFNIFNTCNNTLLYLNSSGQLSNMLFKKLKSHIFYKKLSSFDILAKLHKEFTFDTRPIINCSNSTLSVISKTVDFYLFKLVINHFSYLKDSQNFIQLTLNKKFNKNEDLNTADVKALYTNIPLDDCIIIISDMMTKHPSDHFTSSGFHHLLKLVLLNNCFYYKSRIKKSYFFFKQIKGVAMGTACGPSVANLYMAYFELKYRHILMVSLYHRFLDDLVFIKDKNLSLDFKEIFPSLDLKVTTSNKINFLDLYIKFNPDMSLFFDLYIKPTNTFSYLSIYSNHPHHIKRSLPISLLFRLRRICSNLNDYYFHATILHKNLLKRGFLSKNIMPIIRQFAKINRELLIPYKQKNNFLNNDNLLLGFKFDRIFLDIKSMANLAWKNSLSNDSFFKKDLLSMFFRINYNLNSYFVNKLAFPYNCNFFNKCSDLNCNVCKFANTDKFLNNSLKIPIAMPCHSTCTSKNCIYILNCKKCNKFYVGETGRTVKERFKEHLACIKRAIFLKEKDFLAFTKYLESKKDCYHLYNHFSSDHDLGKDFNFQVFVTDFIFYRLRMETDLIFCLNTQFPSGLNIKVSNLFSLEKYESPPLK